MKKEILKPQFTLGGENISIVHIEDGNRYKSLIAGFNWKNTPYPCWHKHTHWEILVILDGKVNHTINDLTQIATKGYACLIRPNDTHCFTFKHPKSETLTFCFSNEVAKKLFSLYPLDENALQSNIPLSFSLQENTLEAVISKTLAAQFYPKEDYEKYAILIINRLFLAYNEQRINSTEAYPEWLNTFLRLVKNPKYLRLPIGKLAEFTPYSQSYLSMLFKEYTGKTIVSYLQELKLIRAKELLKNSDYTISEIIVDLNYESLPTFTHTFKKFTGLSPTEFRKTPSAF